MIKSILAGIMISIGFLTISHYPAPIGALSFSIGLYMILWFGLDLYTGKIGYAKRFKDFLKCFLIFIGNTIGCLTSLIIKIPEEIVINKISTPIHITFIEAVICGILMYGGVQKFKEGYQYAPGLAVFAFILAGTEHSVADMCYIISARYFTLSALIFIVVVIIGNAFGALLIDNFKKLCYNYNKE